MSLIWDVINVWNQKLSPVGSRQNGQKKILTTFFFIFSPQFNLQRGRELQGRPISFKVQGGVSPAFSRGGPSFQRWIQFIIPMETCRTCRFPGGYEGLRIHTCYQI